MSNNKRIFKYVTITVIRNMRELLKYAFRKYFIRWEILIKSDIKNCIYRMISIFRKYIHRERKEIHQCQLYSWISRIIGECSLSHIFLFFKLKYKDIYLLKIESHKPKLIV